jgi:hypothetical protein
VAAASGIIEGEKVMKNTIIAAAAVLTLALGSASAFAAAAQNQGNTASQETTAQHDSGVNASTECDNILANSSAYSRDQVENCRR